MIYDVIIVGAGPAGVSASLYAKRANLNVLILYHGTSQLEKASKIDNYYGFKNEITGEELYQNGIEQAKRIGVDVLEKEITSVELLEDNTFKVKAIDDNFEAKSVIIATGNKKIKPEIKGIEEFEGRGVSYCAICDGFFYRKKNVVIIGNGRFAISEANDLANIANSVKILTNGLEFKEECPYEIDTRKIVQIHGENKVEKIEFEDGEMLEMDGIFIAQGVASGANFAKKLGILLQNNNIVVNENMETNIKGIFACGDITGGLLQINKAVYEGAKAGLQAVKYIKQST